MTSCCTQSTFDVLNAEKRELREKSGLLRFSAAATPVFTVRQCSLKETRSCYRSDIQKIQTATRRQDDEMEKEEPFSEVVLGK